MTCNQCCNECEPCESDKKCCDLKVIAGNCTEVEEDDNGAYIISAKCPPRVMPGDGVGVEKIDPSPAEGYSVDYVINASDKRVGVCADDDRPGTLDSKLRVTGALTREIVGCGTSNGYMELGIDASKLNVKDEKVAVNSGCSSKYLKDAIIVDSDYIEANVADCALRITDKKSHMAYGKITLQKDIVYSGMGGNKSLETLITKNNGIPELRPSYIKNYAQNMEYDDSLGVLRIKQKGLYNIGFTGAFECAFGVHAVRIQLYAAGSVGDKPIIETRYSAPVGVMPKDLNIIDSEVTDRGLEKLNLLPVASCTEATGVSGMSTSLGALLSRMPFGGSTIIELDVGDIICLGLKVQTHVEYDGLVNIGASGRTEFAILGGGGGNGLPNFGTSIYAHLVEPL